MKGRTGQLVSVVLPLVITIVAGCILVGNSSPVRKVAVKSPATEHRFVVAQKREWLNGVALHEDSDLARWIRTTGEHPDVIAIYTRLNQPFPYEEVRTISRTGALPLLQVNPRFTNMSDIASGKLDAHIRLWARRLRLLDVPVAISFAHEMNGYWDTWGCTDTSGKLFVAVWRHIHDIIGTHKVIWVWNVNNIWKGSCSMKARYPGNAYVSWVGMDGYLRKKTSTFNSVFLTTLDKLRRFTNSKPILITETGVPAGLRQSARLKSLYEGARQHGLIGIIYFDSQTIKGDYRPQDNQGVLRTFRKLVGTNT